MSNKKILVAYSSKYGATKQLATWIAEELGATLAESKTVKPESLQTYDVVIYGGGLYAGGISGVKLVTQHPCQHLVLFTVGLSNPANTDYTEIINKGLPAELIAKSKIFHLRGGVDYQRLSPLHRLMMSLMKGTIQKKPQDQWDQEDRNFMDTYGKQVSFLERSTIEPVIAYVNSL